MHFGLTVKPLYLLLFHRLRQMDHLQYLGRVVGGKQWETIIANNIICTNQTDGMKENILVYGNPYVSLNTVPLRFIVNIFVKMWNSSKHFGTKIFKFMLTENIIQWLFVNALN